MTERRTPWVPAGRCSLVAADVVGFGRKRKNLQVQIYLRDCLYTLIENAFVKSEVDFSQCYSEDRGDGFVVAVPPDIQTAQLVHPFVEYVRAGLRLHNVVSSELAQMRLRVALHSAEAWTDSHGLVGDSVIHVFRLLDAPSFKLVMSETRAYLAVIASNTVYDEIIRHAPGLIDPDDYAETQVDHKELSGTGWVRLVGRSTSFSQSA